MHSDAKSKCDYPSLGYFLTPQNIFDKLPERIQHSGEVASTRKRRQGSPQSQVVHPSFANNPEFGAPRRASTFPESMPNPKRTSFPQVVPHPQAHFADLGRDSPYTASPRTEFFDAAPSLTPTSSTPSNMGFSIPPTQTPIQGPPQSFPATPLVNTFLGPAGLNVPVSDVSAMMFPSADPFAYPNQPMTTFENNNLQNFAPKPEITPNYSFAPPGGVDLKTRAAIFAQRNAQSPTVPPNNMPVMQRGDTQSDSDVQLFGPMPMYLMPSGQMAPVQSHPGFAQQNPQGTPFSGTQGAQGGHVNLDDLFSGEEWANTFMDQGIGFGPGGFGRGPGRGGMGMGNWR